MKLNRLDSAINRENRAKLNENMSIIENDFSNMNIDMKESEEAIKENSRLVNQANSNANRAVILANAVQDELDSIVVEGDSSVEAAQARTNSDTGETYSNLRARLDNENKMLNQRLAQTQQQTAQQIEYLEVTKAPISEVHRLENEKASLNYVNTELLKKASLEDVASLAQPEKPIFVDNITQMTDNTRIYVLKSNMHIYVYDSVTTSFVDTTKPYQAMEIENASVTRFKLSEDVQKIITPLAVTQQIGGLFTTPSTDALAAGSTRIFKQPISHDGFLESVDLDCKVGGMIKIKIFQQSGSTYTFISESSHTVLAGRNTLDVRRRVLKNYVVGYYSDDVTIESSVVTTTTKHNAYYSIVGDIITSATPTTLIATTDLSISFNITSQDDYLSVLKYETANIENFGVADIMTPITSIGTRILNAPPTINSFLKEFIFYSSTAGKITLKTFVKTDVNTFKYTGISETLDAIVGMNTLKPSIIVQKDEYVGWYSETVQPHFTEVTNGIYDSKKIRYWVHNSDDVVTEKTFTYPIETIRSNIALTYVGYNGETLDVETIGKSLQGNLRLAGGNTRILDYAWRGGTLTSVKFHAQGSGMIKIKVFTKNGATFTLIDETSLTASAGYNHLQTNIYVPKGGYVGWYSDSVQIHFNSAPNDESIDYDAMRIWTYVGEDVTSGRNFFISDNKNRTNIEMTIVKNITLSKIVELESKFDASGSTEDIVVTKDENLKNPLYFNTPEGYNQALHPSVLYFDAAWNGYKYWAVQSPLPIGGVPYADRWEYPCIYASHDGINWIVPNGLTNPLDDLTPAQIANGDYFSDNHLVYREDLNRIECWYRLTTMDRNQSDPRYQYPTIIIRKYTTDGINWSERELLIDLQAAGAVDNMVRSQSVIWDNVRGKYRMWWVDKLPATANRDIAYSESSDGKVWDPRRLCIMDNYIDPWHLDVNFINGVYYAINYSTIDGALHLYESDDNWSFKFIKTLLKPEQGTFYSQGLYRSVIVYDGKYKVYFTGKDYERYYIGLMIGETPETMTVIDGNFVHKRKVFNGLEIENTSRVKSEIILTDKGTCLGVDYDTERVYIKKSDGTKIYLF